ncbi:MAG: hypothetical protein J6A28_02520 [Clostridia bacterium]|nr:hypothetical protein [Clostridia bacterium]
MKISKENAVWVFIVALLSGLLALSIYLGMSGWYFKSQQNVATDLIIGKTVQTAIKANEANAISLNLEGAYLPGEKLPQIIAIKNIDDEKNLYIRAKAFIESGDNASSQLSLIQTANWTYNSADGYCYYNDLLTPQNKVALCSDIISPQNPALQTSKKFIITFVFESLDSSQNVEIIWGVNPVK